MRAVYNSSFAHLLIHLQAVKVYHKAVPDLTYHQLEEAFRTQHMNTYLIAFVR